MIPRSELFNFNYGKENYLLARLLVTKQYLEQNNINDAIECLNDVISDIQTDYRNPLF